MTLKRCREFSANDKSGSMNDVCLESDSKEELRVGHSSPSSLNSNGGTGEDSDNDVTCGVGVHVVDPVAFIENGLFNVAENYEALANKKRKALQLHLRRNDEVSTQRISKEDEVALEIERDMMDIFSYGLRRKSKKGKKKGRPKGSKNKVRPEVTKKLGDATLLYAHGNYPEAISLLHEIIRVSPYIFDPYHLLGLVYNALGDKTRALNWYQIASCLIPKDSRIWKLLVTQYLEQGNTRYAWFFLSKAIAADPEDVSLRILRASLYAAVEDYQKAAEAYEEIARLWPENVEALKSASMLYKKCDKHDRSICILEEYLQNHSFEIDLSVIDALAARLMEGNDYVKALQYIKHAQQSSCATKELPLFLKLKEGICNIHLGHLDEAEAIFSHLDGKNLNDNSHLIIEAIDSLIRCGKYGSALRYCMMLEGNGDGNYGYLCTKIATCFLHMEERERAIEYFYKALPMLDDSVGTRLTLSSLLLDEDRMDEAILVLCPPRDPEVALENVYRTKPWWINETIKVKLTKIYKAKGMYKAFVDVVFPLVRDSLSLKKVRKKKELSTTTLLERVRILREDQTDNIFCGLRPLASKSDLLNAYRARKLLEKKAMLKGTVGVDFGSDDSDDEFPQNAKVSSLPNFLKDVEHHILIVDLSKQLVSLHMYSEALEIINLGLRFAKNLISSAKEELQSIGAQIAYKDPIRGWKFARCFVCQNPCSFTAWNIYYRVLLRLVNHFPGDRMQKQLSKPFDFIHDMRDKHKDCVPALVISGHRLTLTSRHQAAAKEYLEAYKLMPDNPLINLSVGTALISLALGVRIQNKNQCFIQGLAFLYNNLRICGNSQEALYNIARAYHHVGLVSLAVEYYEKVLAIHVDDYTIPELDKERQSAINNKKIGHCDLRREAAYNLHLIYQNSGAFDLARQVLKDYCTV